MAVWENMAIPANWASSRREANMGNCKTKDKLHRIVDNGQLTGKWANSSERVLQRLVMAIENYYEPELGNVSNDTGCTAIFHRIECVCVSIKANIPKC